MERGGPIVAYPDVAKQLRTVDGRLAVASVPNIDDDDLREAYRLRAHLMGDDFVFRSAVTGKELSASFDRFPEGFPRPWEIVILTPTDDFIGSLKAANRQAVAVIAALTALELLLIYGLSKLPEAESECCAYCLGRSSARTAVAISPLRRASARLCAAASAS